MIITGIMFLNNHILSESLLEHAVVKWNLFYLTFYFEGKKIWGTKTTEHKRHQKPKLRQTKNK